MRYSLTLHKRYLAAVLFTAVGLGVYGCGDSATVNPEVELSRLSVTPGSLQPGFGGGTTQYRVDLTSDITTVTVSAQAAVAGDRVTINSQPTTSQAIALDPPGSTTVVNVVVADTDTNSRTYVVRLVRAGLAGNNSLQSLDVSAGPLTPSFNANELLYTVDVANTIGSIVITPTLQDPNATMTVNGQDTNSGQPLTVNLEPAGQSTTIRIDVTAQNGTTKTYLVVVSRGVSSNRNLQSLGISPGSLSPSFSTNREDYTVNVGSAVESISVTPRLQDSNATMRVNGQATNSGQARSITLAPAGGSTFINIVVTAQNNTSRTYSVEVRRAALGGNNNLQSLSVSPGSLSPSFSTNREDYTVNVGSAVESISVTPRLQDTAATLTVTSNGQVSTSGQARIITLRDAGFSTTITIAVRAPNGSVKPYTITVDRAAPPLPSGNNNLQSLTVSPGTLSPSFSTTRARTDYAVNDVSSSATAITVTAIPQDSNATVEINQQAGNSRSIPLPTGPSSTEIEVRVMAPNGTDKTYSITVTQPAPAAPPAPPASGPDLLTADDSCDLRFGVTKETETGTNEDCNPDSLIVSNRDDNFTNVTTPRFRVPQLGQGEIPNLYVDGSKVNSIFDAANNTLQPTVPLGGNNDGIQHSITSTVTNTATNLESDQSDALIVTVSTGQSGV